MNTSLDRTVNRVLAAVAVLLSIRLVPQLLGWFATDWTAPDGSRLARGWILFATLAPAVLLVLFAVEYARRANRPVDGTVDLGTTTPADVHAALISVAGLLIAGLALGDLPDRVYQLVLTFSDWYVEGVSRAPGAALDRTIHVLYLAAPIAQFVVGALLIAYAVGVARILRRRWRVEPAEPADGRCPHCGWWYTADRYRPDAPVYLCSNCRQEIPADDVRKLQRAIAGADTP